MRELRAGPLTLLLDERDIRRVRWREVELVRRLGVAVRDPGWRTVPARGGEAEVVRDDVDGLAIRVAAHHADETLDVRWEGLIEAGADGRLSYAITWRAEHDAGYNRIGLVALLPPRTVVGRPCATVGPAGEERITLPEDIVPQPWAEGRFHAMLPPFSSLAAELPEGTLTCTFTGDLFEIEDQRNWADDSFKVYGTPLARPLPQHARAGAPVEQGVHVAFAPNAATGSPVRAPAHAREDEPVTVRIGGETGRTVPPLGLIAAGAAPAPEVVAALRRVGPAHLRHDVHPGRAGWGEPLRAAVGACAALGCGLELAVHTGDPADLAAVCDAARDAPLIRLLVFGTSRDPSDPACCTPPALAAAARRLLDGGVPLTGGTDLSYADLNRWRPDTAALDEVTYTVSAQVHERDDLTVVENVEGMAATVASARHAFAPLPIAVGRVALREGEPDARLPTSFGAAWALAAVAGIVGAGAASVTTFAAHDALPSPLADALAAYGQLQGAPLLAVDAVPTPVAVLAARTPDGPTALLANPGDEDVVLSVSASGDGAVAVRLAARSWRRLAPADLRPSTPTA
ncbi:MAG TPA: hypothetical protein VI318_26385 [Baekduia sp.]